MTAAHAGQPPTKAVAEHFGAPRSTAGRWVWIVRALGFIPPVTAGKSPRRNPKVAAVADALGVSPFALEQAIRKHANGDLRITN